MLAQLLAIVLGLGSFILFTDAFLFPEVHRKGDFTWSGVGFLYALVLWVCAGQFTGGILLGQVAGVALIGWLEWQMLSLRWQGLPVEYRARSSSLGAILVKAAAQVQRIGSTVVDRAPTAKSTKPEKPTLVDPDVETTEVTPVEAVDGVSDVAPTIATKTTPAPTDQPVTEVPASEMNRQDEQGEAMAEPNLNAQVAELGSDGDPETDVEPVTTELQSEQSAGFASEDDEAEGDQAFDDDQVPAVVEVPAAEQPIAATTPMPKPAKSLSFIARINNGIQQTLINLGIKKKPRPTIVLDRSPKPDSQTEAPIATDDAAPIATADQPVVPTDTAATDLEKATKQVDQAGGLMQSAELAETAISETASVEARDGAESGASGSVESQTGETETSETETSKTETGEMDESVSTPEVSSDGTTIATNATVSETTSDGNSPDGNSSDGDLVDVAEIFPDETTDETTDEPVMIELTGDGEGAIVPPQQETETASSESTETTATTDGLVGK